VNRASAAAMMVSLRMGVNLPLPRSGTFSKGRRC
jgi:hypothetical protein